MKIDCPQASAEVGRNLLKALNNTGISVLYQDMQLQVVWAQNVPSSWSEGDIFGTSDDRFLPQVEAERVIDAKKAVLKTGHPQNLEIYVPAEGGNKWFNLWIDADHDESCMGGVVTTAVDITEQKQREQTLRTLLGEVSHRSKNLLAIIQSIATQTGRYSRTIDEFLIRFRGRLQSLASSQDLITSSNWRGVDLHELIASQVGRYAEIPKQTIYVEGINPFLNTNAAVHIGLALHELAVNSASYGALSRPDGRVNITARIICDSDVPSPPDMLELVWAEELPSTGKSCAGSKRFGSVVLEKVVPVSLGGIATLEVRPGRLEYRLHVPERGHEID